MVVPPPGDGGQARGFARAWPPSPGGLQKAIFIPLLTTPGLSNKRFRSWLAALARS